MRLSSCLATWLPALLLVGCDIFDPAEDSATTSAPPPAGVAAYELHPAGTAENLANYLADGWAQQDAGVLLSQKRVGAPMAFTGGGPVASAGGGTGTGSAAGLPMADSAESGAMRGADTPADDGLANDQVNGVEEADLVRSDGQMLYVAEQPDLWVYPMVAVDPVPVATGGATRSAMRIAGAPRDGISISPGATPPTYIIVPDPAPQIARYQLDPATPAATALPPLALTDAPWMSKLQLLLAGGTTPKLIALGESGNNWGWERWFAPLPYVSSQETNIWIFDVADAAHVPAPVNIKLKGELVESRRIGRTLYVISRYSPHPVVAPAAPLPMVPAMAVVTDSGTGPGTAPITESHDLVAPGDCLLPAHSEGFPSLMLITAINIDDPSSSHAVCYSGEVYTLYMSRTNLYVAATQANPDFDWGTGVLPPNVGIGIAADGEVVKPVSVPANRALAPVNTIIHQFALNNGNPRYVASGRVPGGFTGWLGVGSQPRWRFNERNGRLFVMTSWWDAANLQHRLFVLENNNAGKLAIRATLPNEASPQAIGHTGEDIYAMRYVGDRAYVVTFRRTDPLYVIDLADPLTPRIAGELTLPGFSAYLHPVGDGWLLGVGRNASNGFDANLFDVRDPAHPAVQQNVNLCTSCDAPVLTDFHAIAALKKDAVTRVAIPLQRWDAATSTDWRPIEQAALLEVETSASSGVLRDMGHDDATAGKTALGRVLLIADAVFQPQKGMVTTSLWPSTP